MSRANTNIRRFTDVLDIETDPVKMQLIADNLDKLLGIQKALSLSDIQEQSLQLEKIKNDMTAFINRKQ